MEELTVKPYDNSLQNYESRWIESVLKNCNKRSMYRNPTASLYTSMVYGFANHLPYSMDIEQPEYVPADFLNMVPYDALENNWFKWDDRKTFFIALVNWGDTYKTGMLLQMCNVFQKMILGQFQSDFILREEDYINLDIDSMTKDKEYNRNFFEILKSLPDWYRKLVSATDNDKRRKVLEEMYADIMNKIAARYGTVRKTEVGEKVITFKESKGTTIIRPSKDVEMLVYWDDITFHDGIPDIIEGIKQEQLINYNKRNQSSSEPQKDSHILKLK